MTTERDDADPFGLRLTDKSEQNIADLFSKFMSPEIANFLSIIIKSSMGDVINNTTSGGGITGPGSLFGGRRDVGVDMMDTFNRRVIEQVMTGSQQALQRSQFDQNVAVHEMFGKDRGAAEQAASGFSVTNVVTAMMMAQMQPKQLLAGLSMATGYMGAGSSLGLSADQAQVQQDINTRTGSLMSAIANDYTPENLKNYYGLGGADVGRLTAEMARTGGFNGMDNAQAIEAVRQSAAAVSAGSRFFEGGAMAITDQMNAVLGVNAVNTFGGEDTAVMFRRMTAVGKTTGLTTGQMMGLGTMSAQMSRNFGLMDSTTALSVAAESGIIYSAALRTGGRFVNERRLRESIVGDTVRAAESDVAKMVSGVYSTLSVDDRETFMNRINESGAGTTTEIGDIARGLGAVGSDMTFLNIGDTYDAKAFRSKGIGIQTAMFAQMTEVSDYKRKALEDMGLGYITDQIEGPITIAAITPLVPQNNIGKALLGNITNMFNQTDRDWFNKSTAEMDAEMLGIYNMSKDPMRARIKARVDADTKLAKYGKVSGIQGALAYASMVADDKDGTMTLEGLGGAILGINETNITELMQGINPKDFGEKAQIFFKEINDDIVLMEALDISTNAMNVRTLNGKELTTEQHKKMLKFRSGNMSMKEAREFANPLVREHGDLTLRKELYKIQAADALKGIDINDEEGEDEINKLAMFTRFGEIHKREDFLKNTGGDITPGILESAKGFAEKYTEYLKTAGTQGQDIVEREGILKTIPNATKEGLKNFELVREATAKQDPLMANSFGPATSWLEKIFRLMERFTPTDSKSSIPKNLNQKGGG